MDMRREYDIRRSGALHSSVQKDTEKSKCWRVFNLRVFGAIGGQYSENIILVRLAALIFQELVLATPKLFVFRCLKLYLKSGSVIHKWSPGLSTAE